jgi:hypothetical protein
MPRKPKITIGKLFNRYFSSSAIRQTLYPLMNYSRCESPAFVRKALNHAIKKDLKSISPYAEFIPNTERTTLGHNYQYSKDTIQSIENEEHINQASYEAATQLKKARLFFEQAEIVEEEIKPIFYYYGGIYFLDFICFNLVRRIPSGSASHGIRVTYDSTGWDFNREWVRNKCRVQICNKGDFPFYIDALTTSGFISLFSGFRLYRNSKTEPWELRVNPHPLFINEKASLELLCNFDLEKYLTDYPEVKDWLKETDKGMVWKLTSLLMDLIVVFVAASLARYATPAWNRIIEAYHDDIYNDIRSAYINVSEGFALFFEDEYPFQYSYDTRINPC